MDLPVTVGVDGSPESLKAADLAAEEARLRQCPLRVLHALPLMPHLLPAASRQRAARRGVLADAQHVLAVRHPDLSLRADQVHDVATVALVAAAEDAGLLVLAARGSGGFPGLRVGSTALHVAGRAGCPVVVLPAGGTAPGPREQVVVGVDARRPAEAALDFAFAAASRYGLPVRALHAWASADPPESTKARLAECELLDRAIAPWRAAHPDVQVIEDAERGGAGQVLVEASAKARLVVLGRHDGAPLGGLGPVAHAVLHHAACPVALVPGA